MYLTSQPVSVGKRKCIIRKMKEIVQDGKKARWKQIHSSALVYWEDGEMKVNSAMLQDGFQCQRVHLQCNKQRHV